MGYTELYNIANIVDPFKRLKLYSKYYSNLTLNGLHYVQFIPTTNSICVSLPNHQTHHEATSFLLIKKFERDSINTVRGMASDIKKFLDFIMIWNLALTDADLLVVLEGYVDYLRLIKMDTGFSHSIEWSLAGKVPLNLVANSMGKLQILTVNSIHGLPEKKDWSDYPLTYIQKNLRHIVQYLDFLKRRTTKYQKIQINTLPVTIRRYKTMISGTTGPKADVVFDVKSIIDRTGLKTKKEHDYKVPINSIFTNEEANAFLSVIDNYQDKLLFTLLRYLGIRAGEAAGINVNIHTIPRNFLISDKDEIIDLAHKLKGDLQSQSFSNRAIWTLTITDRGNSDYRSGHKKAGENRDIPWLYSQEELSLLLYYALRERSFLMKNYEQHGFLFVSRNRKTQGCPITGKSIYQKFQKYRQKLLQVKNIDLSDFSPHTFRHLYATDLIRNKNITIDDVSRWLGHSNVETTRGTYSHWLPTHNLEVYGTVLDIANTFHHSRSEQ